MNRVATMRLDTGMAAALMVFSTCGTVYLFSSYSGDLKEVLHTERKVNIVSFWKDLGTGSFILGALLVQKIPSSKLLIIGAFTRGVAYLLMWLIIQNHVTVKNPMLFCCISAFVSSLSELVISSSVRYNSKLTKKIFKQFLIISSSYISLSSSFLLQIQSFELFGEKEGNTLIVLAFFPGLVTIVLSPLISRATHADGSSAFISLSAVLCVIVTVKPFLEPNGLITVSATFLLYSIWVSNLVVGLVYSTSGSEEQKDTDKKAAPEDEKVKKILTKENLHVVVSVKFILIWLAGAIGVAITTTVIDNLRSVTESLSGEPKKLDLLISLTAFANFTGKMVMGFFSLFLFKKKISPSLILTITLLICTVSLFLVAFPILLINTYLIFFLIGACHGVQVIMVSHVLKAHFKKIFYLLYSIFRISIPCFTYILKIKILSFQYEKASLNQLPPFIHKDFTQTCVGVECYKKTFIYFSTISLSVTVLWIVIHIVERKSAPERQKIVTDSDSPSPSRPLG